MPSKAIRGKWQKDTGTTKKRAVFFDLGGTLLVMRRDRIFRKVLAEEGYRAGLGAIHSAYVKAEPWWLLEFGNNVMTPEETEDAYRRLDEKAFSTIFPRQSPGEALRVSRQIRKRWPELEGEIPLQLYPDVEPTLNRLKRERYLLGLISNAPADTGRVVEALGLSRYLDSVIISGVVGYSKPNPEIFRIAMSELRVGPEEAVHVGDLYEADVLGAKNAGILGLLIVRDGEVRNHDCPSMKSLSEVFSYLR